MAKTPSFSFYTSDFLTETIFLSFEDKGKLITLLCLQHQLGHLTKEQMEQICGNLSAGIMSFFQLDAEGKYFCEKIDVAKEKRAKFVEKQRQNGSKKWNKNKVGKNLADAKVMPNEKVGKGLAMPFENENEIEKEIDKGINKGIKIVKEKGNLPVKVKKQTPQAIIGEYFKARYKELTGIDYLMTDAEYSILAGLLKDYSAEIIRQRIEWLEVGCKKSVFWFAKNISDFTIFTLKKHWNKIVPILTEEQKKAEAEKKKEEERMKRVLAEAQRLREERR